MAVLMLAVFTVSIGYGVVLPLLPYVIERLLDAESAGTQMSAQVSRSIDGMVFGALHGAVVVGGVSALGAALFSIGGARDKLWRCGARNRCRCSNNRAAAPSS